MKNLSTKKMHGLMHFVIALAMVGMLPISATAALQAHPNTLAIVTNQFSNSATIADLSVVSRTLTPVALTDPIREAWNVKITPDGTKALISGVDDGIVCVIDLTQDPAQEIARVSVGGYAMQIAITPDGKRALVGNESNSNVTVLDLTVNPPAIIRTITMGSPMPNAVGITPDGLYAIIGAGSKAYVLNLATYEVENDIAIGSYPMALAIDSQGKVAVINTIGDNDLSGNGRVSILDLTTTPFSLKTKVVVGKNPGSEPAITQDGKYAVVANADSDDASIIDLTLENPVVVSTLSVGDGPRGVAIIGTENIALVANRTSGSITEIDLASLTILGSYPANSSPNHIAVFKKIINQRPVASAGVDQIVNEGAPVSLNGSGSSDPDNDPLTYKWTQLGGPTVSLSGDTTPTPSFTAPLVPLAGVTLSFQLVVSDGKLDSDPSVVNIAVKNVNQPPIADAGTDQSVKEGSLVTLNGSGSYDLEGETISYSWIQTAGTGVTLSDASVVNPTFTAPAVSLAGETLTFQLTVNDGTDSRSDSVNIFIENVNHPPIANAGLAQTVNAGSLVTLDGTASADPDNDPLTYQWNQTSGPTVTLSDSSYQAPTFTAPDSATTLGFELVVHDGTESSPPTSVTITVQNVNDPPACDLAQAKPGTLWPPNHKLVPVEIVGVTDPNNDNVTITITGVTQDEPVNGQGDGDTSPDAVIQGNKVLLRAERAGNGNGRVYHITFTATDGNGATGTGTVSVSVPHDKRKSAVDDGLVFDSTQP